MSNNQACPEPFLRLAEELAAWQRYFPREQMLIQNSEDFFGDTGDTFQAAIGFINFEGTPASEATQSYGLGVDDMVVKWREFTLEEDTTDCGTSGSCAVIQLATSNVYEGQAVMEVTVLDAVNAVRAVGIADRIAGCVC